MTKTIKIPGYRTIIPNSTWGREVEPVNGIPVIQVMCIERYRVPTKAQVIKFIQEYAKNMLHLSFPKDDTEEIISIAEFLCQLPNGEISRIAEGKKDTLCFLGKHYPQTSYQPGRTYLEASNGILSTYIIGEVNKREPTKKRKELVYNTLVNRKGKNRWNLRIRLNKRDTLPQMSDIEALLSGKKCDPSVLRLDNENIEYQDIRNQARMLYDLLSSQEKISKISDNSDLTIRRLAATTVMNGARGMAGIPMGLEGLVVIEIHLQKQENPKPRNPSAN